MKMQIKSPNNTLAIGLLFFLLQVGCSTAPVVVDSKYDESTINNIDDRDQAAGVNVCDYEVNSIQDFRLSFWGAPNTILQYCPSTHS